MTAATPFMGRDPTPDRVEQVIVIAGRDVSDEPGTQTASTGSTTPRWRGSREEGARPGMIQPVLKATSRS
jgi:hypothetical protein